MGHPRGLHKTKDIFAEKHSKYLFTHSLGYQRVHTFPKSKSLKVNIITWLGVELTKYTTAVNRFNH